MQFRKFGSIENSYRDKTINEILKYDLTWGSWTVQEKVHGANASLWYDGHEVRFGKKSGFVSDSENFYGHRKVLEENTPFVHKLWSDLQLSNGDILVIYGEIFGGNYPHPDVEKQPATCVQKGVYYCPDNKFYAFDIATFHTDNPDELVMFDSDEARAKAEAAGFFFAGELFRGSFKEALEYQNEFQTTIPGLLNLPEIENNVCEGVVIRPVEPRWLPTGSRVILKNKNAKFKEVSEKPRKKKEIQVVVLSDAAQNMLDVYSQHVTENRLRNVLSHMGGLQSNKQFGKLVGAFSKDVFDDFIKDYEDEFNKLEKDEQKLVKKRGAGIAASLVRDNILNILDGNF